MEHAGPSSESGTQLQEIWGGIAVDGFLWVPTGLFRQQGVLNLTNGELVVLLNLLTHWWKRGNLPFPSASTLAKRIGTSRRTVLRHLAGLEKKQFIRRVGRRSARPEERAATRYDMGGLVAHMKQIGAIQPFQKLAKKGARQHAPLPYEDHL